MKIMNLDGANNGGGKWELIRRFEEKHVPDKTIFDLQVDKNIENISELFVSFSDTDNYIYVQSTSGGTFFNSTLTIPVVATQYIYGMFRFYWHNIIFYVINILPNSFTIRIEYNGNNPDKNDLYGVVLCR